jgi:diadenosine tetraphosphate (Ap4A) HIT family hydrolase
VHVIPRYDGDPLVLPWTPGGEPAPAEELEAIASAYR